MNNVESHDRREKKSHRNESGREIFLPGLGVPISKVFHFLAEMGAQVDLTPLIPLIRSGSYPYEYGRGAPPNCWSPNLRRDRQWRVASLLPKPRRSCKRCADRRLFAPAARILDRPV
jgi:hypothetical protein